MIYADTRLSAADKKFMIEDAFAMKGGKTFTVSLQFDRGRLTETQDVDGTVNVGTEGSYTFTDAQTLVFQEPCSCPPQTFRVTPAGDGFRLELLNRPTDEKGLIAVRTLYEAGRFVRVP